jgi:hypothetical protein
MRFWYPLLTTAPVDFFPYSFHHFPVKSGIYVISYQFSKEPVVSGFYNSRRRSKTIVDACGNNVFRRPGGNYGLSPISCGASTATSDMRSESTSSKFKNGIACHCCRMPSVKNRTSPPNYQQSTHTDVKKNTAEHRTHDAGSPVRLCY